MSVYHIVEISWKNAERMHLPQSLQLHQLGKGRICLIFERDNTLRKYLIDKISKNIFPCLFILLIYYSVDESPLISCNGINSISILLRSQWSKACLSFTTDFNISLFYFNTKNVSFLYSSVNNIKGWYPFLMSLI